MNFFMKFHSFHKIFTFFPSYCWILIIHFLVASINKALNDLFLFWIDIYGAMIIFFQLLYSLSIIKMIEVIETYAIALKEFYKFLSQHAIIFNEMKEEK
jgi:hypothetical protein